MIGGPALRRIAGAAVALPVAAALLGQHPALRGAGPLARTGRDLAGATAGSVRALATLGAADAGAPAATVILVGSVIVAAVTGMTVLAAAGSPPSSVGGPGASRRALGVALAHGAAVLSVLAGAGDALYFAVTGGVAAAALLFPFGREPAVAPEGSPPARARAGAGRIGGILLLAVLLFLAAGAADGLLQSLRPVPAFPEAWYVVAVESGAGLGLPVWGVMGAAVAASFALSRAAGPRETGDLLLEAGAWTLLLGPSNPVRGFALAFSLQALARAGLPAPARAVLAPALTAGMAALVFAV